MAGGYEVVIVGAGHNGLTCACYLAKAASKSWSSSNIPTSAA
jgi:glycine/D-amino acid oxidase-like deaminating enzyme